MKQIIKLSLLLLLFNGCATTNIQNYIIQNTGNVKTDSEVALLINSGTILLGNEIEIDNVLYDFASLDGRIVYIETHDNRFTCEEGLSMSSTIADCLMTKNIIEMEPGVGLFMKLKNGWRVYLSSGSNTLNITDKVLYFCFTDEKLSNSVDLKTWIKYNQSITIPEEQELQEGKVLFFPIN